MHLWKGLLLIVALLGFGKIQAEDYKIVGYYPGWAIYRTPAFKPQDINAKLITHINYAFVKADISGNLILFDPWADIDWRDNWNTDAPYHGNFKQLQELKKANPHLKTLFSIGGWTLSDSFSFLAANPTSRHNFVKQCIDFCDRYGFDGIDIDWEYPGYQEHSGRPEDTKNFTLLLKELHMAAKARSPQLLVTIAAPAGPGHIQNLEVEAIHHYLDWINLMCYDFAGAGWTNFTNHHAALYPTKQGDPLFNCDAAINAYLAKGVPSSKLVLGIPLYGRSFANVESQKDGLFCPYKGAGSGTTAEAGMRFYWDIQRNLLNVYQNYWDEEAKVPYLFNPANREFITYEDERSLIEKTHYIRSKKLGGAMIWELGMDMQPTWPAMSTLHKALK